MRIVRCVIQVSTRSQVVVFRRKYRQDLTVAITPMEKVENNSARLVFKRQKTTEINGRPWIKSYGYGRREMSISIFLAFHLHYVSFRKHYAISSIKRKHDSLARKKAAKRRKERAGKNTIEFPPSSPAFPPPPHPPLKSLSMYRVIRAAHAITTNRREVEITTIRQDSTDSLNDWLHLSDLISQAGRVLKPIVFFDSERRRSSTTAIAAINQITSFSLVPAS